jgi:hypothetical protein
VVEDVTQNADGTTTTNPIMQCNPNAPTYPCWRLEMKAGCASQSPDGVGLTIDRNNMPAPPNTTAQASCSL